MTESKSKNEELSWFRKTFWPVYSHETSKVLTMITMLALALFNYTCLRINKDSLVMTAYGSGKDVLPILKLFLVLPATLFFVKKFWDLSNNVSRKNLFYVTLMPFLTFFIIFSIFIFPFSEKLHASHLTIDSWQAAYPRFRYIIAAVGNWSFSLFYVCSELWGNVVISLLFWNFANAAFSKDEAKRIFTIFASYSNIGLVVGGLITKYFFSASIAAKKLGVKAADSTTTVLACVVLSGLFFAALYWYLNEVILAAKGFDINTVGVKSSSVKKEKPSTTESLKMLWNSKYLMYVTILVLSYGMTANLVEVTWKGLVKSLFPSKDAYGIFMCDFFIWTGIATCFIGFCCKGIVKKFGWLFGALATPVIMLITSASFYIFLLFGKFILPASVLSASLFYAVIVGSIQNILSKGAKYTLFDPTVQMSYQPLNEQEKIKGKAAVDVIGGRAGKSLGSVLQIMVVMAIPGWEYGQQFAFMILVIGLCISWIYASIALSKEYERLSKEADELAKQKESSNQ
ncbi:Npt1/Npt2 family nucleotide transporter [Alphaproteobacteria bacterium endosymbiont of Tiliacea citrago]|uniref:Npt1/Npt2 family nucleotide transporter n=1 Tax=Alphaproteobacteria bacterium endosymbiont of Tiliacea citrago TaxID=3077944 RepID=UPI00313F39E3